MRGMTGRLYTTYVGIRFCEVLETLAVEMKLVGAVRGSRAIEKDPCTKGNASGRFAIILV